MGVAPLVGYTGEFSSSQRSRASRSSRALAHAPGFFLSWQTQGSATAAFLRLANAVAGNDATSQKNARLSRQPEESHSLKHSFIYTQQPWIQPHLLSRQQIRSNDRQHCINQDI